MAEKEDKKPSRAERMYGKGPKIEKADKGESGAQKEEKAPASDAAATAGAP